FLMIGCIGCITAAAEDDQGNDYRHGAPNPFMNLSNAHACFKEPPFRFVEALLPLLQPMPGLIELGFGQQSIVTPAGRLPRRTRTTDVLPPQKKFAIGI